MASKYLYFCILVVIIVISFTDSKSYQNNSGKHRSPSIVQHHTSRPVRPVGDGRRQPVHRLTSPPKHRNDYRQKVTPRYLPKQTKRRLKNYLTTQSSRRVENKYTRAPPPTPKRIPERRYEQKLNKTSISRNDLKQSAPTPRPSKPLQKVIEKLIGNERNYTFKPNSKQKVIERNSSIELNQNSNSKPIGNDTFGFIPASKPNKNIGIGFVPPPSNGKSNGHGRNDTREFIPPPRPNPNHNTDIGWIIPPPPNGKSTGSSKNSTTEFIPPPRNSNKSIGFHPPPSNSNQKVNVESKNHNPNQKFVDSERENSFPKSNLTVPEYIQKQPPFNPNYPNKPETYPNYPKQPAFNPDFKTIHNNQTLPKTSQKHVGNQQTGSYPKQPAFNPDFKTTQNNQTLPKTNQKHVVNQQAGSYPKQPSYDPNSYNPGIYNPNYQQPPYHTPGGYQPPPNSGYQPPFYPQPGLTIINNNINSNHHNPYIPPNVPRYRYTIQDTGSDSFGYYLGTRLREIKRPTYTYSVKFYDGYRPRYDHYTIHHYYHNSAAISKEKEIAPNTIVGCWGDSSSICPSNTTSLCTNNGAIMCVASVQSTVPCKTENDTNCIRTSVPCLNSTECKNTTVTLPCISTAKIFGNVTYVNNTIIISNSTDAGTYFNGTYHLYTTVAPQNPQMFCVTVLATPAKREMTEGEKLMEQTKGVVSKFLVKALGIS